MKPRRSYKWRDTLKALENIAASGPSDQFHGVLLEYTNPLTGGPTMPTIGFWIQWLAPGETTKPHRHTSTTIYHVVQGQGVTTVGENPGSGQELMWGTKRLPAGAVLEMALASKYVEEGACDCVLCYRPAGVEKFGTLSGGAVLKDSNRRPSVQCTVAFFYDVISFALPLFNWQSSRAALDKVRHF